MIDFYKLHYVSPKKKKKMKQSYSVSAHFNFENLLLTTSIAKLRCLHIIFGFAADSLLSLKKKRFRTGCGNDY